MGLTVTSPPIRVWFLEHPSGQQLIQLQQDRFLRNWRQIKGDEEYHAAFLPPAEGAQWRLFFRLPENRGRLHAQMNLAVRNNDRKPVIILDLTARGAPTENRLEEISNWFEIAHAWIVRGFTELTTEEMHKLWGRLS